MASTLLGFTQTTPLAHAATDWLAYFVGARVYLRARRADPVALGRADLALLFACTLFGAAAGAVLLHALASLSWVAGQGAAGWISGKSVLGALLGGTLGTEAGKALTGWRTPTGDAWVPALAAGLVIGRLGCQLAGTWDMTYGIPTGTAWGWDYGDGVPRYPTGLLEIAGVALLWMACRPRAAWPQGRAFNAFLLGYCLLRIGLDFLKPPFGAGAAGGIAIDRVAGLSAIQWAALAGAAWFSTRLARERSR